MKHCRKGEFWATKERRGRILLGLPKLILRPMSQRKMKLISCWGRANACQFLKGGSMDNLSPMGHRSPSENSTFRIRSQRVIHEHVRRMIGRLGE